MKKVVITIVILALCAGCGFGACLFLKKGDDARETEAQKAKLVDLKDVTIEEGAELPQSIYEVEGTKNITKVEIDTNGVDRFQVGSYPIVYKYRDKEGTLHQETIQCKVIEATKKTDEKEEIQKETSDQDRTDQEQNSAKRPEKSPPKTGEVDVLLLMLYSVLLGLSATTIWAAWHNRKRKI